MENNKLNKGNKKRILVIGTGGTIASVKTKDGLRPAHNTNELISFFPEVEKIADIEGRMLFNLDSANMQPHHWSLIAEEIGRQYDRYDGFVITHGTDTMHYTSAALSFMLQDIGKPVVLTGSVNAIEKEGSDAGQNFTDSVIVACSGINEVCVVFHGKIIKGCKARKVTNEATRITNEDLDVYSSINYHLVGEMIGKFVDNHKRKIVFNEKYSMRSVKDCKKPQILSGIADDGVFLVKIYPGFRPEMFDKLADFKCVVIEAFGPGNIPFIENSLVEKIGMLIKRNVSVFVTTQNPFGEVDMNIYEVGQRAMRAGAIPCNDMTSDTALVKLMWIMGNFGDDPKMIREMMMKNFVGEIRV